MTVLEEARCDAAGVLDPRLAGVRLEQLYSFLVLAEELHFGRAARRLHVSGGGLSRRISLLEAALGTPVLHRLPRRLQLTPSGERLAAVAHVILSEMSSLP